MPVFGINNIQHIKNLADALDLPAWLVKVVIVEYLPCRRFQGNTVTIDYGLVTVDDIRSITKPYVILNGLALFHNVTKEVLHQRLLSAMVGFPMANLAKQEAFYMPEGKVSPHCQPNPIRNSDEEEGDWKLGLHLFKKAVVVDDDGLYQSPGQNASSPDEIQHQLENLYKDLETLHVKMRETVLIYHQQAKNQPWAKVGYTEEAPPQ